MRRNGCALPLHPYQVTAVVLLVLTPVEFGGLATPLVPYALQVTLDVVFGVCYIALICAMGVATVLDPAQNGGLTDADKICNICKIQVDETSKHCISCDKCVVGFDHHCKWLNNCVGRRNYPFFIVCIGSLEPLLLVIFAGNAAALGILCTDTQEETLGRAGETLTSALLGAVLLATFSGLVLNGHLICFHLYLRKHQITTFDYVSQKRKDTTPQSPMGGRKLVLTRAQSPTKVRPSKDFSVLFAIPPGSETMTQSSTVSDSAVAGS